MAVLFLLAVTAAHAEEAKESPRVCDVTVRVVLPDGKPALDQEVQLYGLERDARNDWNYTTGADGTFRATFQLAKAGGELPGEGVFYFIAGRADTAGAISAPILNGEYYLDFASGRRTDVSLEKPVKLKGPKMDLTLRIRKGITLKGWVRDAAGKPLAAQKVGVSHDLGSFSHTGYGGDIFHRSMITNSDGYFEFADVFPSKFGFGVETGKRSWIRTRVRKRWYDEVIDEVRVSPKERSIEVEMVSVPGKPFRFHGRITDQAGAPIAAAKVTLGVSHHRVPQTWGDDHRYESVESLSDGTYSIELDSPFVRGFSVERDGWERADRWTEDRGDNASLFTPGKYDFELRKVER